jgi:hypothetical protein
VEPRHCRLAVPIVAGVRLAAVVHQLRPYACRGDCPCHAHGDSGNIRDLRDQAVPVGCEKDLSHIVPTTGERFDAHVLLDAAHAIEDLASLTTSTGWRWLVQRGVH